MRFGKVILITVLMAILCAGGIAGDVLAGNPPPDDHTVTGPEFWGVLTVACANNQVSLRVKKVENCNVLTDSLIEGYPSTPCVQELTEAGIEGQWFGYDGVIFEEDGVPIITRAKNKLKIDYNDESGGSGEYSGIIYTFDVQIRFCTDCAASEDTPQGP